MPVPPIASFTSSSATSFPVSTRYLVITNHYPYRHNGLCRLLLLLAHYRFELRHECLQLLDTHQPERFACYARTLAESVYTVEIGRIDAYALHSVESRRASLAQTFAICSFVLVDAFACLQTRTHLLVLLRRHLAKRRCAPARELCDEFLLVLVEVDALGLGKSVEPRVVTLLFHGIQSLHRYLLSPRMWLP